MFSMRQATVDPVLVNLINLTPKVIKLTKSLKLNRTRMGLLKTLVTFGAGFYGGAYAAQNYKMPPMDDPSQLIQKIQDYLEQFKK
ncbi:hypothetical protein HDE_09452 [Halotydeus destructor]|nr:hypothetical protein HDE_09452 [Halotydeus destructor]